MFQTSFEYRQFTALTAPSLLALGVLHLAVDALRDSRWRLLQPFVSVLVWRDPLTEVLCTSEVAMQQDSSIFLRHKKDSYYKNVLKVMPSVQPSLHAELDVSCLRKGLYLH